MLIIPNPEIRALFRERTAGFLSTPGILDLIAMEAAFRHGDPWLDELMAYLDANLRFLQDYFKKRIPKIKVTPPEGTYLIWLDFRDLGLSDQQLREVMRKEARVALDDGYLFGTGGEGFQRINIACSRSRLEEALNRIEVAVNNVVTSK